MTKYEQAKRSVKVPGTNLRRVNSRHATLTRTHCPNGHPARKFGVFNAVGHLRCRRCMTDAQLRYLKKKKAAR